jgi:hypothetical protein
MPSWNALENSMPLKRGAHGPTAQIEEILKQTIERQSTTLGNARLFTLDA